MMKHFLGTIVAGAATLSLTGVLFLGCGSPLPPAGSTGGPGSGGGSTGATSIKLDGSVSSQGAGGGGGSSVITPTGDANCGSAKSGTSRQPADMLLVLDRSGSMSNSTSADTACNGAGCVDRWTAVTSAVTTTLTATAGSVNWGLKLFSSTGNACGVTAGVEVAPGSANAAANIQSTIGRTNPGGNTPTAQAVDAAVAYLTTGAVASDGNSKYILLATDGEPNCGAGSNTATNVPATVTAITAAKNAGILVYVIGIGPSAGNLDSFAAAGGTGTYFPATTPQALTDAFATISKAVASCTFNITTTAGADTSNPYVYLDGTLVNKDPANGWSPGANATTIQLNGTTCDAVMTGGGTVNVFFACAGAPPPPTLLF